MKKIVCILCFVLVHLTAFNQDIKIRDGVISIDGKECLKIDKTDPNNVSIYDWDGNEIIFLKFIHNSRYAGLYNKITFMDQKLSFTSKSYIFTIKLLLKKLLADNTLQDCKLNPEKVEKFVLKFDENVETPW